MLQLIGHEHVTCTKHYHTLSSHFMKLYNETQWNTIPCSPRVTTYQVLSREECHLPIDVIGTGADATPSPNPRIKTTATATTHFPATSTTIDATARIIDATNTTTSISSTARPVVALCLQGVSKL